MAANNFDDALEQMRAAGLVVEHVEFGRLVRCLVDGDREKRGWYILHELRTESGDELIVGSYGVWRGNDNGAQKIELTRQKLSVDERATLRQRLTEDRRRARAVRDQEAARAAARANAAWLQCTPTGESSYLVRKGVGAHGLRFSPSGALAIPMLDTAGRIHGLQIVRGKQRSGRPAKEYWPAGIATKGHFHLIGSPSWIVLVVEGYATGASLHEATGLPVAIAFDAGNLAPVATALHQRYKLTKILICADDDILIRCRQRDCKARIVLDEHPAECPECGRPHLVLGNVGAAAASNAALAVGGSYLVPTFADEAGRSARYLAGRGKISDFNDVHLAEGLHVVRTQVEAQLTVLGWRSRDRAAPAGSAPEGAGSGVLRPVESLSDLLDRFSLVYAQGGTIFDHREHCLLTLSDMRDACISRQLHRAWMEHPDRKIVRSEQVGFDPAEQDAKIDCNLWGGWDGEPKAGSCERLLELLQYMCSGDARPQVLYDWVLNWIAYPIQHAGAKMKTTLVVHGPQGTGKNLLFEALMGIYGRYGRVIDQSAIEDKFNDWASKKLFLLADEVVARSDLYHVKNKLKAFITGDWIRINPKNMAAYDERNHANVVFLSNEPMPVVLEEDDRRHAVIWTPEQMPREFYAAVVHEIEGGGVAALHDYLLHLDLGDFGPASRPPRTTAKNELISLSLDSTSRFFYALTGGDIDGVEARPALSTNVYELYKVWCSRTGYRPAPQPRLLNTLARKHGVDTIRKRYNDGMSTRGPRAVVMLGVHELPPGTSEPVWLGGHIDQFFRESKDYKGENFA